jgi:hypothetical protein
MRAIVMLAVPLVAGSLAAQERTRSLPGVDGEWVLPHEATLVAPYRGREALWLRSGPRPFRQDVAFLEGTIEFDVEPLSGAGFVGVMFRRESRAQYETVFFRPGDNGAWDALQYMPRVGHASQWQLYPEYQARATLPEGQWTHVRLVVEGDAMRFFVGGSAEPTLEVPRLRGKPEPGTVGFWVSGDGDNWAAVFSNILIRPAPPSGNAASRPTTPPAADGYITAWDESEVVPADSGPVLAVPQRTSWTSITAEENGLVNLSVRHGQPRGRNTVFLRHSLDTPADRLVPLELAYSDEVTVFLDGRPLYSGVNRWEGRYPGYLAPVGLGAETVYLPLKRGSNELIVALTDEAFGWGLIARVPPVGDRTP